MNSVSAIKKAVLAHTPIPHCLVSLVSCYARPGDEELLEFLCRTRKHCEILNSKIVKLSFVWFSNKQIHILIEYYQLYRMEYFLMTEFKQGFKDTNRYLSTDFISPCENMIAKLKDEYEAMIK